MMPLEVERCWVLEMGVILSVVVWLGNNKNIIILIIFGLHEGL